MPSFRLRRKFLRQRKFQKFLDRPGLLFILDQFSNAQVSHLNYGNETCPGSEILCDIQKHLDAYCGQMARDGEGEFKCSRAKARLMIYSAI